MEKELKKFYEEHREEILERIEQENPKIIAETTEEIKYEYENNPKRILEEMKKQVEYEADKPYEQVKKEAQEKPSPKGVQEVAYIEGYEQGYKDTLRYLKPREDYNSKYEEEEMR